MKLLVTGATGFVGYQFAVTARDAGHSVTGLVRRPAGSLESIGVDALIRDIRDIALGDVRGYDAIVHFAAATSGTAEQVMDVTVGGTAACIAAAIEAEVPRFIHISSASVYPGRLPAAIADVLDTPLDPYPGKRGTYPHSKIAADRLVLQSRDRSPRAGTEITIVRPGMVFGENMASPLAGTAVEAPGGLVLGLGRPVQRVPYVHAQDLSRGILGLLAAPLQPGETRAFDAFSPNAPTKAELVRIHGYLTGRSRRAVWVPGFAMVALARLAEAGLARSRPGNALGYKVARYYDLRVDRLPVSRFWDAAATVERVAVSDAVVEALTLDRDLPETRSALDPKAVAGEHLAASARSAGSDRGQQQEIVIVGAGRVVEELHFPAIRALGLRVAAVVDRDRRAAIRLASKLGAAPHGSLESATSAAAGEGTVVIATPGPTHADLAQEAIGLGWNVLLEKPAATSRGDYAAVLAASIEHGRRVTVMHNYRFRPATMALWRLLRTSDVGQLVGATVDFQMGRISGEPAGWSREDRRTKSAVMELAIHFIDVVCSLAGAVAVAEPVLVDRRRGGRDVVSVTATGRSTGGAQVTFHLGYAGTAHRTRILLEFERSTIEVGFFPDGCRVLPRRSTPIDEGLYAATRFTRFVATKLPPRRFPVAPNAAGHFRLYRHHLRRTANPACPSVCDLASIAPTMDTLYALSAAVYDGSE